MRFLFLLFKSWIEIIQKFKLLQNMGSSWTPTAPSLFPSRIGYNSWEFERWCTAMQPLFSYKFSVNPLFLQNTRGKFLKYFFEEQDTALLLLGIRFILLFYFTCQFSLVWRPYVFVGLQRGALHWKLGATWWPTLEVWCNVVATCTEILHFEHSLTSYATILIKYYNTLGL